MTGLVDSFGRRLRKLRISVTDRCNFRCQFCMPEEPAWLPRENLLTFEEIARVASLFGKMGINQIRLSGGEPLLRQGIEKLVSMLSSEVKGIESLAMTTNGFLLAEKASALRRAGLTGITVSLHSLNPLTFEHVTGVRALGEAIKGIRAARSAGFGPVKVNAVVIRGCNDNEIVDLASLGREEGVVMRFIEYMPFDGRRLWGMEKVVTGKEIVGKIRTRYDLEVVPRQEGSTAMVYRFKDGTGEIGIITSITDPFCSDCNRIRLSADGRIVPCLFDTASFDLEPLLRGGASDAELSEFIRKAVWQKAPGVKTLLNEFNQLEHIRPMYTIGG